MVSATVSARDLRPVSDLPALVRKPPPAAALDESEAFKVLSSMAHRKTGLIPVPLLVKHVLSITQEGHWPLKRAAMEAVLRRVDFSRADRLEVASRPAAGALFGLYATRRRGSTSRPYRTTLEGVNPPRGSCDCPDFLRNSLGLCKHLLAVLNHLFAKPKKLEKLLEVSGAGAMRSRPRLRWNPVRPLTGYGDWLEQVRWAGGEGAALERGAAARAALRWFRPAGKSELVLRDAHLASPSRRRELVRDLHAYLRLRPLGRKLPSNDQEPALLALLAAEEERLERLLEAREAAKKLRGSWRTLKQKLYPYQCEGVERFLANGRLLLADDMGLGKTAQAIAVCHALAAAAKVRRGLLIVPASLKPQWLREWQLFSDTPVEIVDGGAAERQETYRRCRAGFLIANYEQVLRDLPVIHRWQPQIVVLDEAQRIKNWATKTAAYVKQLKPPYRLVLTGTPMENRIEELASILDWVDDRALEPKWRLVPWHAMLVDGKQEVAGAANLDTLRSRLGGCMLRRVRREVLAQLPSRTDTTVPVSMTPEQREEHDALNQPIASILGRARKRPLTQAEFLKLMQLLMMQRIISNGLAQLRFEELWPELSRLAKPTESMLKSLSSPKLIELRELIAQLVAGQRRKVVIFSQWRRMLRLADWAVKDILADCGARAIYFTGEEKQRRRTQNIVDFHDDPSACVLLASDAGGVGLNLQRAANCTINLELPWNPAVLEQRIGRIYRLGQKRPINVYNLVCAEGIESRIAFLVGDKRAFFSGLFDGTSDEVRFDHSGTFLSRIEKVVEPVAVPELPPAEAETDGDEGAEERELEKVIAAADESGDAAGGEETAAPPAALSRERGEKLGLEGLPPPEEVQALFSRLQVRPGAGGGITIEAPPEAASALAALFAGMASMLQRAARS